MPYSYLETCQRTLVFCDVELDCTFYVWAILHMTHLYVMCIIVGQVNRKYIPNSFNITYIIWIKYVFAFEPPRYIPASLLTFVVVLRKREDVCLMDCRGLNCTETLWATQSKKCMRNNSKYIMNDNAYLLWI